VSLPSKFITVSKPNNENALLASPNLQSAIILDQSEPLDWLQERLVLNNEQSSIELARPFPKVHTLSIEEQFEPTLDWLQQRIGLNHEELGEVGDTDQQFEFEYPRAARA
jgi:hypothetical protein